MRSLTLLLLLTFVVSCKQSRKIPEDFDYGKIENNVYINKYFGFEMPVPAGWIVQNKEQMQEIRKAGQKILEEGNKEFAKQVSASDITSASLLTGYKYKTDSVVGGYNPSFAWIAENLHGVGRIKKGADYLEQVRDLMKKSGVSYQFPAKIQSQKLGNKDFDVLKVIMTIRGVDVQQYYYSIVEKGFALSVIVSSGTKEQEAELQSHLQAVNFH